MRLSKVEIGHRFGKRLVLGLIRVLTGKRAPDVLRVLYYRPELFGGPFTQIIQNCCEGFQIGPSGNGSSLRPTYRRKINACSERAPTAQLRRRCSDSPM